MIWWHEQFKQLRIADLFFSNPQSAVRNPQSKE
jgi:hypothetical protein